MAAKGRYLNEKKLEQQYLLVPITVAKEEVTEKTSVNTDETCISAAETPIQTAESTQSKVKDNKEKESIFIIERESSAHTRENDQSELKDLWDQWKMDLLNDKNWCTRLIRISGKGALLLEKAYNAMTCFDDFNLLRALEDTVRTKKDYQSKFQVHRLVAVSSLGNGCADFSRYQNSCNATSQDQQAGSAKIQIRRDDESGSRSKIINPKNV